MLCLDDADLRRRTRVCEQQQFAAGKDGRVDAVAESRRVGDGGHLGHQGLVSTCNVTRAPTSTSALPVPTYTVASGRYRSRLSPCLQLAQPAQCTTGSPAVQRTAIKSASVCTSTITA